MGVVHHCLDSVSQCAEGLCSFVGMHSWFIERYKERLANLSWGLRMLANC